VPDQPRPSLPRAVAVLSITQIIGWGTTFFTPGVLAGPVGRELGLSREFVFSGVSVMLLVAAAASPAIGRMVDRRGARGVMAAGSLVAAAANLALSFAAGPWSWLAGWVLVGLVLPLALASAAFAALAQIAGRDARRAITMVTLFTGVSGSIFWPLTALLEVAIGWRATYGAFAALNLLVCLPLHLWGVPHGAVPRGAGG
jgi:predicted MFS family arabinose efflux permease